MKNLTVATKEIHPADHHEIKGLLEKVMHNVDTETDLLRDILTALNRNPPRVDLAKTLLDQVIASLTGVTYKAKIAKKQIESR